MLVGRAAELAVITSAEAGSTVLVRGSAGIGKSALLAEVLEHHRAQGRTVLTATADLHEESFAFGVVRQLFERTVAQQPEDGRLLAGIAAGACAAVTPGSQPVPAADPAQAMATLHGLYWLSMRLAEAGPLVIVVDDVQWADLPSVRWLAYLLRRVEGSPISVLAALRTGELASGDLRSSALVPAFDTVLDLGGLTEPDLAALITAVRGSTPAAEFVAACARSTSGNPFLTHALLRCCAQEGVAPDRRGADAIAELGPAEVVEYLRRRWERLGADAVAMVRALAVLGGPSDVDLTAAVAGVRVNPADLAHELARADVVRLSANLLTFGHAIVRSAVLSDLPAPVRQELRTRAARELFTTGAAPERIAAQLLAASPPGEGWAIGVLTAAADLAGRRGAPDAAAAYLERALLEPVPDQVRARLVAALAVQRLHTDPEAAIPLLGTAAEDCPDPVERVRLSLARAGALSFCGRPEEAIRVLAAARDRAAAVSSALGLRVEVEQIWRSLFLPGAVGAVRERLAALDVADWTGNPVANPLAAVLAFHTALVGTDAARARELALLALDQDPGEPDASFMANGALSTLIGTGDTEFAAEYCTRAIQRYESAGLLFFAAMARGNRAGCLLELGRVENSLTDAEISVRAHVELGLDRVAGHFPVAVGRLVDALVERACLTEAEELLRRYELGAGVSWYLTSTWLLLPRGRLHLAQGRPEQALADFLECGRVLRACEAANPVLRQWRLEAVSAHLELGRHAEARALAEENHVLAQAWGTPKAVGTALWALGRTTAGGAAVDLLRAAEATLAGTDAPLGRARALSDLGAALHREGSSAQARSSLRAAVALAESCGSVLVAEQARQALRSAGGRPGRRRFQGASALTEAERRVAVLAASGLGNRAIAEQLFVEQRTAEIHLTNAYRKLGIGGRAELARALAL